MEMSMTRNYGLSKHTYLAICIKQYNNWNSFLNHIGTIFVPFKCLFKYTPVKNV